MITQKLIAIQSKLKAPKTRKNTFHDYYYRNCEDILEAVKPHLESEEVSLMVTDTVKEVAGIPYVEARAVFFDGEGKIEVTAQAGINTTKKGMDIAQLFGTSSSYARKYALNGLFLIDDAKDADGLKFRLVKGTDEFNRAKNKIAKGLITVEEIQKSVVMTKEVKDELEQIKVNK